MTTTATVASTMTITSAPAITTTITLVRHGQTHLNARRVMQGACDSPLTRTGRIGVLTTAAHLASESFSAAYSSPQGRAMMTAVEIVRHHPELRLRADSGLREFTFGRFERRPERDLDEIMPWSQLISSVLNETHPGLEGGGESGAVFMGRVRSTFARIAADHPGEHVLVVGHGLTLGAYLATINPGTLVALPNASVSRVEIADGVASVFQAGLDVAGHGSLAARSAEVNAA